LTRIYFLPVKVKIVDIIQTKISSTTNLCSSEKNNRRTPILQKIANNQPSPVQWVGWFLNENLKDPSYWHLNLALFIVFDAIRYWATDCKCMQAREILSIVSFKNGIEVMIKWVTSLTTQTRLYLWLQPLTMSELQLFAFNYYNVKDWIKIL